MALRRDKAPGHSFRLALDPRLVRDIDRLRGRRSRSLWIEETLREAVREQKRRRRREAEGA